MKKSIGENRCFRQKEQIELQDIILDSFCSSQRYLSHCGISC